VELVLHELRKREDGFFLSDTFYEQMSGKGVDLTGAGIYHPGSTLKSFDFVISVGGDGTLLETVTHVGAAEVPILGVNTGRLGFLATTTEDMIIKAFDKIHGHAYETDSRMLLRVDAEEPLFTNLNFGLNEFAVLKQDTSSMITIHAYIDGEFLTSYWADGLIISTPTGSTGYSLSCGGPVVMPHSENLVITPVSPHNLNVRPLIVSDTCHIALEVESRSSYCMVSMDSRFNVVEAGIRMEVSKQQFMAKLIKFEGYSFVDTLRNKLNWGLDVRN
jgi:NAD+ kinase